MFSQEECRIWFLWVGICKFLSSNLQNILNALEKFRTVWGISRLTCKILLHYFEKLLETNITKYDWILTIYVPWLQKYFSHFDGTFFACQQEVLDISCLWSVPVPTSSQCTFDSKAVRWLLYFPSAFLLPQSVPKMHLSSCRVFFPPFFCLFSFLAALVKPAGPRLLPSARTLRLSSSLDIGRPRSSSNGVSWRPLEQHGRCCPHSYQTGAQLVYAEAVRGLLPGGLQGGQGRGSEGGWRGGWEARRKELRDEFQLWNLTPCWNLQYLCFVTLQRSQWQGQVIPRGGWGFYTMFVQFVRFSCCGQKLQSTEQTSQKLWLL